MAECGRSNTDGRDAIDSKAREAVFNEDRLRFALRIADLPPRKKRSRYLDYNPKMISDIP